MGWGRVGYRLVKLYKEHKAEKRAKAKRRQEKYKVGQFKPLAGHRS